MDLSREPVEIDAAQTRISLDEGRSFQDRTMHYSVLYLCSMLSGSISLHPQILPMQQTCEAKVRPHVITLHVCMFGYRQNKTNKEAHRKELYS